MHPKRQTSEAISQKTQRCKHRTPSSGQQVLLNRVRASQHFPKNTQVMVNPAYRKDVGNHPPICGPFKDDDVLSESDA